MKSILAVAAQFLLYLLLDAAGSLFYQPFHVRTALSGAATAPRTYIWDGLILAVIAYVVVVLIAAVRRRLDETAPWSTLALVLAAVAGYGLKLGFVTQNW